MECNEEAIGSLTENYRNVLITKLYSAYEYVNEKFHANYTKQYNTQMNLEVVYSVTASIDIERRKRLFEILDKIKQEKIIIFITHNIEECVYCDQIYAVKNRSVQQISYKNLSEAYS